MGTLHHVERKVAECGTRSGYNKHARLGESSCENCKAANASYYMERYKNDPEYRQGFLENQYSRHKERMSSDSEYAEKQRQRFHAIYSRKYETAEFRQELKENHDKWVEKNPERHKELIRNGSRKRRALILGNGSSPYTEFEVLDTYGKDCHICEKAIDLNAPRQVGKDGWEKGLHIDHLIPILKGGSDTLENVRPSHGLCNISKGAKTPS